MGERQINIHLQEIVKYLYFTEHDFFLPFLTDCTKKVSLFELEILARHSAPPPFFFRVIYGIYVELIHQFGCQRIWVTTRLLILNFPLFL